MKARIALLLLIVLAAGSLSAAPPKTRGSDRPQAARVDNAQFINVNRILMFVTNHGNFARDLTDRFGKDAGTFYPYTTIADIESGLRDTWCNYASGLWVGGKVNGEIRVALAEYEDEYVPGNMCGDDACPDGPQYRIYKLYRDSLYTNPNQDYLDWPVDQGAPTRIDTIDGEPVEVPDMIGDQMLWAVYNDADSTAHLNDAGKTLPLGLEIRQTTFAFNRQGSLGDIIFLRFQVYNRGSNTIDSLFLSLWADPDLGGAADDLVGCDTLLDLGYVYNADNSDVEYGAKIPCMGYDFFQGPLIETGDLADTALMWDTIWPGYENMGLYSFNKYINGTDPNSFIETYNYMRGKQANGDPYVFDGDTLLFVHSGDPVKDSGDIDFDPADRRWMQTTGPITFAPGDSTEILAAIIVGQGREGDAENSITKMRELDEFAQKVYENGFNPPEPPAAPNVRAGIRSGEVILAWDDTSLVDPGDYPFQGFTVWQGEGPGGPWKEIATYDLVDTLEEAIIDTLTDPYSGLKLPMALRTLPNTGLRYTFWADHDYISGGPLNDVTEYFFRVTAFSWSYVLPDSSPAPAGDRFLESERVFRIRPHTTMPGVVPAVDAFDTLAVTHVTGTSDAQVLPLVLDPLALNGHTYRVEFVEAMVGSELDTVWNLIDLTANDTLRLHQTNVSGDGDYIPFDGVQTLVVSEAGVVAIDEIAGAEGVIDPPDNVMYSLNSTGDWYVDSDVPGDFSRLNWRGHIGISDWEFRFTATGSEYYDWNTDEKWPNRAPFEVWNIGEGTPDDPSDDFRIQFAIIDDDASGGWSYGDRIYPWDVEYPAEPLPDLAVYTFDDDFHIGRIMFQDNSGATTAPAEGTIVRFSTAKVPTPDDAYTFEATMPGAVRSEGALDSIRVVPNPFYLFGPYDNAVGNYTLFFHGLPAECTIDIYNLAGEWVDRVEKNDPSTSLASWDLLTRNGVPVASGLYIYVVDAPGFGQKIGKFAVFVETEVLKQY